MRHRDIDGLIHETDVYTRIMAMHNETERLVRCRPTITIVEEKGCGWTDAAPTCLRCIGTLVR